MGERFQRRVVAKTAAYTMYFPFDASGTVFSNRGATGSVTFTLPKPNAAVQGRWYEFRQHADQTLIVAGATAGDLATTGNASADNVSFAIGSAKVGRGIMAVCDGTQWLCYPLGSGSGFCVNGTEVVATFASGVALAAPAISGAATIASGAVITTPKIIVTTTGVTGTGATGGAGAVLPTVTPAFVSVTGATGSGVDLPTGPAGAVYYFQNLAAATMRFYCVGGTINGATGTTAYQLTNTGNKSAWAFNTSASGAWLIAGNT